MYRMGEIVAREENAVAMATGENLGQVASQTLHNLDVINQAVEIAILRPLIALDKREIIKIAREIKTYDVSTIRSMCCTVTPKYPSIRTNLEKFLEIEMKMDVKKIANECLSKRDVLIAGD